MKVTNLPSGIVTQRFIIFLKRMAVMLAIVFAVQGCAVFVRDRDDYYHHRHRRWEHERSSMQMNQFAKGTDVNRTTVKKNSLDSEHEKWV